MSVREEIASASLRDAVWLRVRWGWFSTRGRSMTLGPWTGRQRAGAAAVSVGWWFHREVAQISSRHAVARGIAPRTTPVVLYKGIGLDGQLPSRRCERPQAAAAKVAPVIDYRGAISWAALPDARTRYNRNLNRQQPFIRWRPDNSKARRPKGLCPQYMVCRRPWCHRSDAESRGCNGWGRRAHDRARLRGVPQDVYVLACTPGPARKSSTRAVRDSRSARAGCRSHSPLTFPARVPPRTFTPVEHDAILRSGAPQAGHRRR